MKSDTTNARLTLGATVREAREAKELSRERLARHANVSTATVARIELLDHVPTVTVLYAIARALGKSMDDLVSEQVSS